MFFLFVQSQISFKLWVNKNLVLLDFCQLYESKKREKGFEFGIPPVHQSHRSLLFLYRIRTDCWIWWLCWFIPWYFSAHCILLAWEGYKKSILPFFARFWWNLVWSIVWAHYQHCHAQIIKFCRFNS